MNSDRSGRYPSGSYQAVPSGGEALSPPLPQHGTYLGDSLPAPASHSYAGQPPSDGPDPPNQARFSFSNVSVDLDHAEEALENSPSRASDEGSSSSHRRRERKEEWKVKINRWWLYELLGAIFSVACLIALVVVLRRSQGKEQSKWLFGTITLNGLVALLSTFIRAAMMFCVGAGLSQMKWNQYFSRGTRRNGGRRLKDLDILDQASRGPLGSFNLLMSRTAPHLGLIGAIITIFTLAFDAFAQEVVSIRYVNMPGVHGSAVGDIVRSDQYSRWTKLNIEPSLTTDLNTVAAEYNGIYSWQNITAPVAQCSTGNCTWPVVPSLAVCGSCMDLTASISYTCVGVSGSTDDYPPTNCTYHVSEGQTPGWYGYSPGYTFWTTHQPMSLAYAVVGGYKTKQYNQTKYFYIDTWLMIDATSLSTTAVTATACGLWFCVQAYETSVTNGIPTQKVVGSWSETDMPSNFSYIGVNFTNIPDDIRLNATYAVNSGESQAFSQNAIFGDGNATFGSDLLTWYDYTSTTVRALMSIADYNTWIDHFALGMTNNVRSTGTSSLPASTYAGTVLTSVAHVHVRWAWLAFPAAMVAAALSFLAVCIWQTKRLHVPPWKGDALALLLTSVEDDIQAEGASRWKVAEERVRLEPHVTGAVFRKVAGEKVYESI